MSPQDKIDTIKISDFIYLNEDLIDENKAINLIINNPHKYIMKYYTHKHEKSVLYIAERKNKYESEIIYLD